MKIPLSRRLGACCRYIQPGDRVADIGCDHGYLGIYLLKENIAKNVIAADIHQMPLQSARINAEKYGVSQRISFHLSDGVRSIPRDFDVMVCAGMGADTMIDILDNAPWLKDGSYRLILQCQSKTPLLRRYLSDNGWHIRREQVLRDGRFLYTVMDVIYAPGSILTPGQQYFPPAMYQTPYGEVCEYFSNILSRLERALKGQKEHADPMMISAYSELIKLSEDPSMQWLKEASRDDCK